MGSLYGIGGGEVRDDDATGAQADKLRAAGWSVRGGEDYVMLRPVAAMPGVDFVRVNLNADGSLHLVPERSHFHKQLLAAVSAA